MPRIYRQREAPAKLIFLTGAGGWSLASVQKDGASSALILSLDFRTFPRHCFTALTVNRDQRIKYQIALALAVSFFLFGLVLAVPNDAPGPSWAFLHVARATSWHRFFDRPAVWCSLKILLFTLGMFLTFDALGTISIRSKRETLAEVFFFSAILLALLGFLMGDYYLMKALL